MTELDARTTAIIRDAHEGDLPAILDIHNANIADSTSIWDDEQVELADRQTWFRTRIAAGFPVLVADVGGTVAGYASYGQWRPKVGYRYSVENSVYVAEGHHRRGLATALLTELVTRAREAGTVHAMIAAIESSNAASIALHERHGFATVGEMPEVGYKFGHWLDLTLMQLALPVVAE
ncbi:GNAT family N-acetyltransferase [Nocardia australiensis]|uniref:GNAT family N-acetyltransferase n=1 Tax=Nocardia australiensis TaxID=2887191 RepID=UPI001D1581F5|nr:GNAT family N-acetyltransferase [Nocardia australiensis]